MNSELEKKCKKLNALIKETPSVQEYLSLKKQLDAPRYQELQSKIVELQKRLVNEVERGNDVSDLKQQLQILHDTYFSNLLVVNYEYMLEEVNSLFQYINDYINGAIHQKS